MKSTQIAFIITLSERGGAQKHVYYHLKYLDKTKYQPLLITGRPGWLTDEAEKLGVPVYYCHTLNRKINPFNDLRAVYILYKIIRRLNVGIVHCHSSKAGIVGRIAAKLAGTPNIIFTAHGWAFTEGVNPIKRRLYAWIEKSVGLLTDFIIVVSEYDYKLALENRIVCKHGVIIIRNGIDPINCGETSIRKEYREKLSINDECSIVTFISRLASPKDPFAFLELAKQFLAENAIFLLAGDGPLYNKVFRYAVENDLTNTKLLGDQDNIESLLMASDIFCFFSHWEGLPLAVIEAMAAGLPIVASDVGGVPELVSDGCNGYLVKNGDVDNQVRKLSLLMNDKTKRSVMAKESRLAYERSFDAFTMVNKTEKIFIEAINNTSTQVQL